MNAIRSKRPAGQVRQGQVVTTFGPGSLLDLPRHSVLVGGLEGWWISGEEIHEARLVAKITALVQAPNLKLFAPPPENDDPGASRTGVTVWQFPEWFITQEAEESERGGLGRSRLLLERRALTKGVYIDREKKKRAVVPVRFVRACRRGHIGDIDWYVFVHQGATTCRRPLRMEERGTSGDLAEIWVRCECGKSRPMAHAARMDLKALGHCDGSRPWLGPYTKESCGEPSRLLVRTASNAYFPQLLSVISLPDRDNDLVKAVDQVWENFLQYVESQEDLKAERRKKPPVKNALEGFSDEQVLEEVQCRRGLSGQRPAKTVKQAEIEALIATGSEIGGVRPDRPDGDFFARALSLEKKIRDLPWMEPVERVVLVHRLREVVAQVGFTRFEASAPDIEGELDVGVTRADLARETSWLPAVENRGEGVFVQFRGQAIEEWLRKPAVEARGKELLAGFEHWLQEHQGSHRKFFGLPYVLLHSLSHLLITSMYLECGYPASSIRERVYASPSGYGILLYTASPDAEGTLGGLVEAGRNIHEHLDRALRIGELCSNDPVCAQHDPASEHEHRFLLGAACHGCLLIAETCCEQHNDFLDRALVVPTVDERKAAFFRLGTA